MKDTSSSAVKVTYYSRCLNPNDQPKETHKCDGLKVGTMVQFEVNIEVTACPANRNEWNQTFHIYPVGINESLRVDLGEYKRMPGGLKRLELDGLSEQSSKIVM